MNFPKCSSERERRRYEDCEEAMLAAMPFASVCVASQNQHAVLTSAVGDISDVDNTPALTGVVPSPCILRVWGARPYQSASDNSAQAQEYWNQVAELMLKRASLNTTVLNELKQLTPGAGPGVPLHLPISYSSFDAAIVRIACGGTFIASLTATGEVYIVGHGLSGQLGLTSKIGFLRTPQKLRFEYDSQADQRQTRLSSELILTERQPIELDESALDSNPKPDDASATMSANVESIPHSESNNVVIADIQAGEAHNLALTRGGDVFVWGDTMACGLMTVENIQVPTCLQKFKPFGGSRKIVAIGAHGGKSAMISDLGSFFLWGTWPGIAPIMEPREMARLSIEDCVITTAKIEIGQTMGLITFRLSEDPERSLVYQFGTGIRGEILTVTHLGPPEIPRFQSVFEERYTMYVPECISEEMSRTTGVPCYDIKDIAVGNRHVIVLTNENRLLAWGDNTWGQCGVDSTRQTHISEPTLISLKGDVVATKISAGGDQSAFISSAGALYVWGCSRDHRLANSGVKLLAEAPIRALGTTRAGIASLGRGSTIGTSTQASIQDSIFQPERLLALAPVATTAVGIGTDYLAVATGSDMGVMTGGMLSTRE